MNRKLTSVLATAGVMSAGWAIFASPADAAQRTFVVTLLGGAQVTVTLDVPPGTPVDQIQFPGINVPIEGVVEVTSTPAPTPTATPTPAPTQSPTPSPTASPKPTPTTQPRAPQRGGGQSDADERPDAKGKGDGNGKAGDEAEDEADPQAGGDDARERRARRERRSQDGALSGGPDASAPGFSMATPGAAPIGVPNFFIDKFRIPPFLLPIYQAAGIEYGIRWEILAAINEIETDYGRNLNVSYAGAEGWMQFMPATWEAYGTDANRDGAKDPYNPVDAIFSAARYLKAAGADSDIRKALFAYNRANWYVDSVLMRARLLGGLPSNFVGSLTGLTQGRFPVAARATYADQVTKRQVKRAKRGDNAAVPVESDARRTSIDIFSKDGAPAVAAADGRIVAVGRSAKLGRFVKLRDVYGNTYTYAGLGSVEKLYPAAKPQKASEAEIQDELELPKPDAAPDKPATTTDEQAPKRTLSGAGAVKAEKAATPAPTPAAENPLVEKQRLFANPLRENATSNGGADQILAGLAPEGSFEVFRRSVARVFGVDFKSDDVTLKPLRPGARVVAGTVLGKLAEGTEDEAAHLSFAIKPAGRKSPQIDPKPILDGWKLLETTEIYRAQGRNPFSGPDARRATVGQILLMSKEALTRQVLNDPRIEIYEEGRRQIRLGQIDRRVLATLSFLSANGLRPTVTSLYRQGSITTSGNLSHHASGNAVDIAAINGITITPETQGEGSITDIATRRLLTLQGTMKPTQIITLMEYPETDNTFAMGDHDDHIHVGFNPLYGDDPKGQQALDATLKPDQWIKLVDRLNEIDNPSVVTKPSKGARLTERAARAKKSG